MLAHQTRLPGAAAAVSPSPGDFPTRRFGTWPVSSPDGRVAVTRGNAAADVGGVLFGLVSVWHVARVGRSGAGLGVSGGTGQRCNGP